MPNAALAPLAFGDHYSRPYRSMAEAADEASRLTPGFLDHEFLDRDNLSMVTSVARINGLSLVALSTSPSRIAFGPRPEPAIGFPVAGLARFKTDRDVLSTEPSRSAVFIPMGQPSQITSDERSAVVARLDPARLQRTARTMLGVPSDDLEIVALSNPRQIGLQLGNFSFDAVFRSLFAQIDLYAENPAMLNYAGIDDTFYRNLVIAFNPTPFIRQIEARKVPSDQRRLQRVCEYVMANLSNCITLTDLERVAHMSRRTLHNAFIKTYKQSPMYWVREQRLLKAMKLLGDRNGFLSVTEVLYSCGFTQPSLFSAQYARRFGELPSETLMQAQKGS